MRSREWVFVAFERTNFTLSGKALTEGLIRFVFDLGRRLATAGSTEARAVVEAEIERNAVAGAVMILNADASSPADDTVDRDAYCESRR